MLPRTSRRPAPAGVRRVAILTLLTFGCATVRVPASTMAETVPVRGGVAEPQIELWLESGRPVSPAESAQATAQARAALGSALAGVSAPQGDAILVVRAQGVARTRSRRSDQRAAVAGMVVGAVVIVAAVVAVLVATKGQGGGGKSGAAKAVAARPAPRAAPAPKTWVAPVRPARWPAAPLPRPAPGGRVVARWPGIHLNVFAGIALPPPGEPAPEGSASDQPAEVWESQVPAPAWAPSEELPEISLPPLEPLDVADRGFFDGDTLRLELVVVDRRDGRPLWTKVVDGKVDPRDAQAVQRLLDEAVADEHGWMPARSEDASTSIRGHEP